MGKRSLFLIGIVVGQLLMVPHLIHLINTPRIEALVVPEYYTYNQETFHLLIRNLHGHYTLNKNLQINIAPEAKVNEEYQKEFHDNTPVMGFYSVFKNVIWCVYDPQILIHEIRHVTEGAYHR